MVRLMPESPLRFSAALPYEEALALAQFLKRAGHTDYLRFTERSNSEEAYRMLWAADKLRAALAENGVAPR